MANEIGRWPEMFSKCLGHTGDKQKVCLAAATIAEAKRLHKVTFLSPSLKGLCHELIFFRPKNYTSTFCMWADDFKIFLAALLWRNQNQTVWLASMKSFTNWVNLFRELATAFRKPPMTPKIVSEVYACGPENSSERRILYVYPTPYQVGAPYRHLVNIAMWYNCSFSAGVADPDSDPHGSVSSCMI